eukprot:5468046-Prymnesium_polylepis.1
MHQLSIRPCAVWWARYFIQRIPLGGASRPCCLLPRSYCRGFAAVLRPGQSHSHPSSLAQSMPPQTHRLR